jgi:hypothetical protein
MFHLILNGRRLAIDQEITYIGRDPSCCHVVISDDTEVSRKHVCLIDLAHKVILLDLKSSNGTLLNSVAVEQETLKPGDQIQVGRTVFTVDVPQPPRIARHITSAGYRTYLSTEDYTLALKKTDEHLRGVRDRRTAEIFQPYIEKIKSMREPAQICQAALEVGMTLSGSDRGFVMMTPVDGRKNLDMMARIGLEEEWFLRRNLHFVLIEEAMENTRVVLTKDVFLEKVFTRNTLVLPNVGSAMAVPVIYLGQPIGVIYADRRVTSGTYQETDTRNLVFATYQASQLLGNLRLLAPFGGRDDIVEILECALQGDGFINCEVCGERIERGVNPLVACLKCETLHHKDCWEYNNRCAIYGCMHAEARPAA